ncbi:MAG: hypothetical protein MHM6MM_001847 [Cercozoa sp. M6MM]
MLRPKLDRKDPNQILFQHAVAASFADYVDKRVLCSLRDGRHFAGVFRSFDQFGSVVLSECCERIFDGTTLREEEQGILVLRGENLATVGVLDEVKDAELMAQFRSETEPKAASKHERRKSLEIPFEDVF